MRVVLLASIAEVHEDDTPRWDLLSEISKGDKHYLDVTVT